MNVALAATASDTADHRHLPNKVCVSAMNDAYEYSSSLFVYVVGVGEPITLLVTNPLSTAAIPLGIHM